jgi:hypothetical protein
LSITKRVDGVDGSNRLGLVSFDDVDGSNQLPLAAQMPKLHHSQTSHGIWGQPAAVVSDLYSLDGFYWLALSTA